MKTLTNVPDFNEIKDMVTRVIMRREDHIRKADQKGKWNPIWQDLVTTVAGRMDSTWQVSVLADSGL